MCKRGLEYPLPSGKRGQTVFPRNFFEIIIQKRISCVALFYFYVFIFLEKALLLIRILNNGEETNLREITRRNGNR